MNNKIFAPYQSTRAFEDIADQIKQAILSKRFKTGDRLPSERTLAEQFQVGRLTIREALRTLETKGFIEIKKGSGGGAFIGTGNPEVIASIIFDNLQLTGITEPQITEARIGLECAIAKAVLENGTVEDMECIQRDIEESEVILGPDHAKEVVAKMTNFHILLAKASHNMPYILFMHALMEWGLRKRGHWIPSNDEQIYSHTSHRKIFETIKQKDLEKAQYHISEHIKRMGKFLTKYC